MRRACKISLSGGGKFPVEAYKKAAEKCPLNARNQEVQSLELLLNSFDYEYLRDYNHLPIVTQDDADIFLVKALKFKEFAKSLELIAYETTPQQSPHDRLG